MLCVITRLRGALASFYELFDGRETDEHVNNALHLWPAAENEVNHVQVLTHKVTDSNETPVQGSDDNQPVTCFAATHTMVG